MSVAFTENSQQLIVLDRRCDITLWNTKTGRQIACTSLTTDDAIHTATSLNGQFAALVSLDGRLQCWDLSSNERLWDQELVDLKWRYPAPSAVAFSTDGRLLITACSTGKKYAIHCFDVTSGKCLPRWPCYLCDFKGLVVVSSERFFTWDSRAVVSAWSVPFGSAQWQYWWVHEEGRSAQTRNPEIR